MERGNKKPFIDLEDAVDSLFNSIKLKKNRKFRIYNQFSESLSILQISKFIKNICYKLNINVLIKILKIQEEKTRLTSLKW